MEMGPIKNRQAASPLPVPSKIIIIVVVEI